MIGCSKLQYPAKQTKSRNLTPCELLQSVKERYHSYGKLEIKANETARISANFRESTSNSTAHLYLCFASKPKGEMRFEAKTKNVMGLTISDRSTVLRYISISQYNEYTKEKGAISQIGANYFLKEFCESFQSSGGQYPKHYRVRAAYVNHARQFPA